MAVSSMSNEGSKEASVLAGIGVEKVIPTAISCSSRRRVKEPALRLRRETRAGFKMPLTLQLKTRWF